MNKDILGSKVKIKTSIETQERGFDGKIGIVYGETTPSNNQDFEIMGNPKDDYAINVYIEDLDDQYWFDVDLIEVIEEEQDVQTLYGLFHIWEKEKNGQWNLMKFQHKTVYERTPKGKWWKFWEK